MKKKSEVTDELRPEYDLHSLRLVRKGPGRTTGAKTVTLDPDVAKLFPTSESVNEGLRFLIRAARQQKATSER